MTDNTPRDLGCLDQDTARGSVPKSADAWVSLSSAKRS